MPYKILSTPLTINSNGAGNNNLLSCGGDQKKRKGTGVLGRRVSTAVAG